MSATNQHDRALSLQEAASLLSGADMDSTKALPDRDIASVRMTDGSNGLAMNLPNFAGKVPATCYPAVSAIASTWDAALVERVARAIALDARAAGAHILLAPGMNIRRSPLAGRNFEYFSEDPVVTGELASAFVRGVQSTGVQACVKHFAANNQETDRMRVSADISERALREIYLRGFERVVKDAKPKLVMAAYNRLNGIYATQNRWLLTTVLRDEWGFDGVVVSDWGAVDDRVESLAAGLDLEMPSTSGASDQQVVTAVEHGHLDKAAVLAAADRVIQLARECSVDTSSSEPLDAQTADGLAIEAAERAAILLRNERRTLPLVAGARVAVVGAFAHSPRFQGGGSAGVNARRQPGSIVDAIAARHDGIVSFTPGYSDDGITTDAGLLDASVAAANSADVAVVVVGLPDSAESEGYDRTTLTLPDAQLRVLDAVADTAARTVVVCIAGGVVTMEPWRTQVDSIVWTGLAGQGVSDALARILIGAVSPSGRLTETIPLTAADSPSHLSFPSTIANSAYGEDIFVGYRGYDELGREVAFPFGHGLSYSRFEYTNPAVERTSSGWRCSIDVLNAGEVAARDVVQLYLGAPRGDDRRSRVELIGFATADLAAAESVRVVIDCADRDLSRWDGHLGWVTDAGSYTFSFGKSSRDLVATVTVDVPASGQQRGLTPDSTLTEWLDHPTVGPRLMDRVRALDAVGNTIGLLSDPTARLMIGAMPIKRLTVDSGNVLTLELLAEVGVSKNPELLPRL